MKTFEYPAYLTVQAETIEEADELADEYVSASKSTDPVHLALRPLTEAEEVS